MIILIESFAYFRAIGGVCISVYGILCCDGGSVEKCRNWVRNWNCILGQLPIVLVDGEGQKMFSNSAFAV
uniref:Uncharacterized protein n=1 Tax=Syphacia muris TaxID=451379 RepID=A0A0N5B1E0_9BILA